MPADCSSLRRGIGLLQEGRRLAQHLEEQWAAPRTERFATAGAKLPSMIAELRGLVESAHRNCSDSVAQMDRELSEVREGAERLRLLPASLMFVSLERAARDAGQALSKRVPPDPDSVNKLAI